MRYKEPEVSELQLGDDTVAEWLLESSSRHYREWETLVGCAR